MSLVRAQLEEPHQKIRISQLLILIFWLIWPVGQAVKTPPFHGGNAGSIPARVTTKKLFIMKGFFLLLYYPRLRVNSIASLPVICSILISIQDRAFHSRLISFSTAVTSLLYFKPKTFAA